MCVGGRGRVAEGRSVGIISPFQAKRNPLSSINRRPGLSGEMQFD
jgi:hypothetical protein